MPSATNLRRSTAAAVILSMLTGCALPLASESELEDQGAKEFQKIKAQTPVSTDVRERAYVVCVADAIIAVIEEPYTSKDWEVEIFDSEQINAFALPDAHIGVYSGLLKLTENPNQLATVIGHEVAHVTHKHALQRYDRELTTQAGVVAGSILTGVPANALGAAAQLGLSLPFNRKQESEADLAGLDYMAAAGFDPRQAVPLWENMEKKSKAGPPAFLSTHPSPDSRIQDLVSRYPEALHRYNGARTAGRQPRCERP